MREDEDGSERKKKGGGEKVFIYEVPYIRPPPHHGSESTHDSSMTRPNAFFGDVASSLIGFFRRPFNHLPMLPDCFGALFGQYMGLDRIATAQNACICP